MEYVFMHDRKLLKANNARLTKHKNTTNSQTYE